MTVFRQEVFHIVEILGTIDFHRQRCLEPKDIGPVERPAFSDEVGSKNVHVAVRMIRCRECLCQQSVYMTRRPHRRDPPLVGQEKAAGGICSHFSAC